MTQYTLVAWLRKGFHEYAEKHPGSLWMIAVNGEEFLLKEIHSDFLLGVTSMHPEARQVAIPFSVIEEVCL